MSEKSERAAQGADNLAQEIRECEERARHIVAEAKKEAAHMLAACRSSIEKAQKEAKQRFHRAYRENIAKAESEAEEKAKTIMALGNKNIESFKKEQAAKITPVSEWILKEVMISYGLS